MKFMSVCAGLVLDHLLLPSVGKLLEAPTVDEVQRQSSGPEDQVNQAFPIAMSLKWLSKTALEL